jgi:excisionase family DNA binding protein
VAVVTDLDALAAALADRLGAHAATPSVGQEPYWTAEQAAGYIAADKQRIYDLRSQGRLRCVKDGSRLLTRRSWLDAYLEGVG